jgi:hypothetical protein
MKLSPKKVRGASMVEYIVGLTALLTMLTMPVYGGQSAVAFLADAIAKNYAAYTQAVSMP